MKINLNSTKFLNNATDIKHKDIITLVDGGRWEESTRFKKKDGTPSNSFKINIKLTNDEVRDATLNWKNVKLLVHAFGDETDLWADKKVMAWKTASENAKLGYVFIFAPIGYKRNEMMEWEDDKGNTINLDEVKTETKDDGLDSIEYPEEEINIEDIPFN